MLYRWAWGATWEQRANCKSSDSRQTLSCSSSCDTNSSRQSYKESRHKTALLIDSDPTSVTTAIEETFSPYELPAATIAELTHHLAASPHLLDFLMTFPNGAAEPSPSRALTSAATIAAGYFLGGLIPLIPYFFVDDLMSALYISIGIMAVALFAFGYVKTCAVAGWRGRRRVVRGILGGLQMVAVGGAAAGAAMMLVKVFDNLAR